MIHRPALVGIEPRSGEVVLRIDVPGLPELFVPIDIDEASERAVELAAAAVRAVTNPAQRRQPVLRLVRGGEGAR